MMINKTILFLTIFLISFSISTSSIINTISIIGDLTSTTALIWIRPVATTMPDYVGLTIIDNGSNETLFLTHRKLNEQTDFVVVFELTNLNPNTKYIFIPQYLPKPSTSSNQKATNFGSFKTLFSDDYSKSNFVFGSCLFSKHQPFKVFEHMLDLNPQAFLLLGDIAYMDFPKNENNDAISFSHMASRYKENFQDPYFAKLLRTIPSYMIWDDHEFKNNYAEGSKTNLYKTSLVSYFTYVHSHNPRGFRNKTMYYTFELEAASFFVLDLRTFRSLDNNEILGQDQMIDLKNWIEKKTKKVKFIVSSVMFTNDNHASDSWFPYQREREELLEFIESKMEKRNNIFILSGDSHWPGIFKIKNKNGKTILFEFSASPIASIPLKPVLKFLTEDTLYYTHGLNNVFGQIQVENQNVKFSLFHSQENGTLNMLARFETNGETFDLKTDQTFELIKSKQNEKNSNSNESEDFEYEQQGHILGFQLVFAALLVAFLALCCCMSTRKRPTHASKQEKLKLNMNKLTA